MASWEEPREFMHSNWSVRDLDERHLQLVFELPSRRAGASPAAGHAAYSLTGRTDHPNCVAS